MTFVKNYGVQIPSDINFNDLLYLGKQKIGLKDKPNIDLSFQNPTMKDVKKIIDGSDVKHLKKVI